MPWKLNPEQQRAVEHGKGPLLIVAGPGSGKTRVITERIVRLLETVPGLDPHNILALTFTEKAAQEMKRRTQDALPDMATAPSVHTFHAFCKYVLQQRHFERQLLDKVDLWIFLRRRMEQLELEVYQKLAAPGAFLHDLNNFFSRCQDDLIEPADFEAYVERLEKDFEALGTLPGSMDHRLALDEVTKMKELARVFRTSRNMLEEANCSSFGSLISDTIRLWDSRPEVLEYYRARFRYVLVDEFQDTNFAQVELLRRLVTPPWNITAVGDDDQAIYRFRGAAHGTFNLFSEAFPGHAMIYLDRNYRSTKRILRAADTVISKNIRFGQKPWLKAENGEGCPVYLVVSPDYFSEAAWVAEEAERLVKQGTSFGDIAVLYRSHGYRNLVVEEFRKRNIPFSIRGLSILSTVIVRDLLAYLALIYSVHDNISLTRVLLAPYWRFPEGMALEVRKQALKDRCSIYSALTTWERSLFKNELESSGWPELKKLLNELKKMSEQASVTALFDRLTDKLQLRFLVPDKDEAYLKSFRSFLAQWEEKSETRNLAEFMEYFQYFREAGGQIALPEDEDGTQAIQMMSVHAAKGLEFPIVFVLSVARQRFPHREEKPVIVFPDALRRGPEPPPDIHIQEERRLFFVAMTRAKERLYVSSVTRARQKRSQFVEDLLSNPVVTSSSVETIEAPEVEEAPPTLGAVASVGKQLVSESAPQRRAQSRSVEDDSRQAHLFDRATTTPGTVHPNIAGWATCPPQLGSEGKLRLSATAIEDYQDCPLKFKFSHYLKIPTGPQPALTFGNIMHQCVRRYFDLRQKRIPKFQEIEKFYLSSWKSVGFEDAYQEETYKKAGIEQLRQFVGAQNEKPMPSAPIKAEEHFQLDMGDFSLEGRIDQIIPLEDHKVELIDYKTGRPRSEKDAEKSLQLSVYALAARQAFQMDPVRLTFYNLTNNSTISSVRTSKELDITLGKIREVADQIRRLIFDPTPGFVCKRCDFSTLCPVHEESFWV